MTDVAILKRGSGKLAAGKVEAKGGRKMHAAVAELRFGNRPPSMFFLPLKQRLELLVAHLRNPGFA
jgi:hypothetical protein